MIRVCFVIDRLGRAGTESQLLALIRSLDRSRIEPSLVLLDGTDDLSRSLEPTDCPVLRLGVTKLVGRQSAMAAVKLRDFWRLHRPDVVQAYFLDAAYFAVPWAKVFGLRRIVRVRNNLGYWLTRRHRLMNRLLAPFVDVTLTNAEAGRAALIAEGHDPRRIEVIENGVDLDRFAGFAEPLSRPKEARVGCVANLRPVKNIDGLIRVARRLPGIEFVVAGDGPERAVLDTQRADIGERFAFMGAVGDVPGFLRTVDLFALPSHSEGMSNALLEAMAAGRAIVATAVGGTPQLVTDGIHGLLVPAGDDAAFADAIRRLIADPPLARRLGAAARQRVEAEYGRPAMARRFEAFYRRLVTSGNIGDFPTNSASRTRIRSDLGFASGTLRV